MTTDSHEQRKPRRLSREIIYESSWMNLYADKVEFPQGRIIDRHYFLDFKKEAVAVLVENDDEQILDDRILPIHDRLYRVGNSSRRN